MTRASFETSGDVSLHAVRRELFLLIRKSKTYTQNLKKHINLSRSEAKYLIINKEDL